MFGSNCLSGGMYSARIPWARHSQVAPPSVVAQTPPHDTPTLTSRPFLGWTRMEWMPGKSAPPPNHSRRLGLSHRERTISHEEPPSAERNSPPGRVPHHK